MGSGTWPEYFKVPKSKWVRNLIIAFVVAWMAFYPIYCSYYKANGVDHYRRHQMHIQGNSMFFNPWQYRVLCPLIIEGLYWTADHTLFKVIEVKGIDLGLPGDQNDKYNVTGILIESLKNPEFVKYTIIFLGFRFSLNVAVLLLCFHYFALFIRNKMLIFFGLMVATLFMGNGVVDSDLTFNTYMDITLYMAAGLVIVKRLSAWWIVLLTVLGALNRETALFIPVLYFFSEFTWKRWPAILKLLKDNVQVIRFASASAVLFLIIFVSIRLYYGFQPVSTWRVSAGWPMLKLNLFSSVSLKSYMELFGVFGFMPLWCILVFSEMSKHLKLFFLVLVPAWFTIHLFSAIAYQSRLFLVPVLLVLLPAVLESLERHYANNDVTPVKQKRMVREEEVLEG